MAGGAPGQAPVPPQRPERVWTTLAPLISAPGRRSMRVYNPDTGTFSDSAKLTNALPARPAAPYLYTSAGRTHLIALDFDDKRGGRAAVDADVATAAEWITRCGGVIVTDRSPGGRHLLAPLAIGTTASARRNDPPGAASGHPFAHPGHHPEHQPHLGLPERPGNPHEDREPATASSTALSRLPSPPSPPARLRAYFPGSTNCSARSRPPPRHPQSPPRPAGVSRYCTAEGADQRLAPHYVRDDPMHSDITAYAQHGVMPTGQRQWTSHSEARMAVLTAAIARGHSRASIAALIAPGAPWHRGLGKAYARYGNGAARAVDRDFDRALHWLCTNVLKYRHPQHEKKNSQGGKALTGPRGPSELRAWLANAMAWADYEFAGKRYRWTVHAVLQTLAWHAYTAGEQKKRHMGDSGGRPESLAGHRAAQRGRCVAGIAGLARSPRSTPDPHPNATSVPKPTPTR